MNIRFASGLREVTSHPGRVEVGKWPLDRIKIQILELEIPQGLFKRGNYIFLGVFVVPQL